MRRLMGLEFIGDKRRAFDVPTPRSSRRNAKVGARTELPRSIYYFGRAINTQTARVPRLDCYQVIDDERDFGIAAGDIFVLACPRQIMAADVKVLAVILKAYGRHIRLSIRRDGG